MASNNQNNEALGAVNNRIVAEGQSFGMVTLKDGTQVRTGTIGALIVNIKDYDRISNGEAVEGITKEELEQSMALAIPTLSKAQLFDIFPVDEWIAGRSPGRRFVGLKAKEMGY